jgi:hypothetical protein
MDQIIHVQGGDIFSGGMEMDFSIQMGSQVVGVSEDLPVGPIWSQAFKIFDLERFVGGPGRGGYPERDGKVNEFHIVLL